MHSAYFSIPGPKGANQDSLLPPLEVEGQTLAAVADGVGGHADGKFASETAIAAAREFFERSPSAPLVELFNFARERIAEEVSKFPLSRTMATTLSVVRLTGEGIEVGHVGDTRVYHLRHSGLVSRTVDQTEVAELVRTKVFTPEEALRYPRRNVLLSSLSAIDQFDFYGCAFEALAGDAIILCSDGLYNTIKKSELIDFFQQTGSAQEFADAIAICANDRGVKDDASVVVMRL